MFKDSITSKLIAINLIILLIYSLPATIFSQELGLDQLYDNTTWQQIDSPNGGRTSYIASNSSKIVLVTPNGFVYVIDKSTNKIIQRFLSDDLNDVENAFINENDEVFINIGEASFKSTDFGASFSKIADYPIKEIDGKNYYSFANSDLLSSDDGGKSWRTLINNYGPESIKAKGDTLLSSGGRYRSSPSIYLSTNNGLSFENITADLSQDSRIIDVDLLNGKPLALSSKGLISYYTDSSWVSIGTLESDYQNDLIVFQDYVFVLGQNLLIGFKLENNSLNKVYSKDNFVTYTSNLSVNKSELILKTYTNTFLTQLEDL